MAGATDAPSSRGNIQYCTFCSKPFTNASSFKRHISYCRRTQGRPKRRQKSCRSCAQAKARCSFGTPCSRCTARNTECIYDHGQARHNVSELIEASPPSTNLLTSTSSIDAPIDALVDAPVDVPPDSTEFLWSDNDFLTAISTAEQQLVPSGSGHNLSFSNALSQIQNFSIGSPLADMMLSSRGPIGTLSRFRVRNAVAERSSNLILQTLRTFPEKMLHLNDLPCFVHPYSLQTNISEPLAVCARICQMFCSRTPDIHGFIWRCVRAEQLRFLEEDLTLHQLIGACQAQIVYVMMFVIEEGMRRLEWVQELLMLSGAVCERLVIMCDQSGGYFCDDERINPSENWEKWLFAETRRRTACVWFLMSMVFSLHTGIRCTTVDEFRMIPLPSAKLQWEANDPMTWQQRLALQDFDGLNTIGNLMHVHGMCNEPFFAQKLDSWNAKTDQLGALLNLAVGML